MRKGFFMTKNGPAPKDYPADHMEYHIFDRNRLKVGTIYETPEKAKEFALKNKLKVASPYEMLLMGVFHA